MLVPVYDIVNCGPRHRFVANGKLVHNSDSVNFQNLPSRDKKKKALKRAVIAPHGHEVINCDSSQIEARVLAWLAGQDDVVSQFANGEDVYSIFATKIYNRPISKANPVERFVGKTCIAGGSLVLCESGWKRIETVATEDRVWDGEEWVCHSGVVLNGTKETLQISGLWLTPDHQVWSGTWHRADYLLQDADTLSRALDIAAANLPSQATWWVAGEFVRSLSGALADRTNTQSITTTSKTLNRLDALRARSKRLVRSVIGGMQKLCRMTYTGLASLIGSLRQLLDAIHQPQISSYTMEDGGFTYTAAGGKTARSSYVMSRHYLGGITLRTRWIELMSMGRMLRATSGSYQDQTTCGTSEKSQTLKPVYDILNCGSRNRFTVLTSDGPLIVHNCILGLGYGTGAEKLRHTLKTQPPGADLKVEECKQIVGLYRSSNDRIVSLWRECDDALLALMNWDAKSKPFHIGQHKCLTVTRAGISLPNGLLIRYPNLRMVDGKMVYDSRKGPVNIWGGAVVENVVQALARIVVGQQLVWVKEKLGLQAVLTVHDAGVWVVMKAAVAEQLQAIVDIMSTAPDWATGLPVACEAEYGRSYGETVKWLPK